MKTLLPQPPSVNAPSGTAVFLFLDLPGKGELVAKHLFLPIFWQGPNVANPSAVL
jgi:hypothetical protein